MPYSIPLTAILSGASTGQLARWRKTGALVPQIEHLKSPYLYSFRDLVAARAVVWLASDSSLDVLRTSLEAFGDREMFASPGDYQIVEVSARIEGRHDDYLVVDTGALESQAGVGTLADVFGQFESVRRGTIPPLFTPAREIEVNPGRMGGWPTIAGTRIPFEVIAGLIAGGELPPEQVSRLYPGVSADTARAALAFERSLRPAA